ncbi:glycosyltransferase family 1 protein [Rhodococcus sp. IEGM 1379]|uniref:glycosyltransferase family 4 protein n=1 Tax=Rhodococcus sp. IEGM 1379 TaxID=3047086 RepID=UPI0024B74452|nr:glycosyltransferase family 1 protein [Rhodococcus sp. IEGM 1379]MDI9915074.1 glycosyltransferase family 1 protein [Rhodococcus sp. IEGM 1379]
MKILMPGRILERHVGGNTTYARALADGLRARDVAVDPMAYSDHAVLTMAAETRQAMRRGSKNEVLHYVADTGPLVRTRTPSVVTVHGIASRWIEGVRNPIQEKVWRTRVNRAIESTDAVITVSESSAEDISEVFDIPRDRIDVIHHGIEHDSFTRPTVLSPGIAARLPDQYLLYIGNIEPRKNLTALIAAMRYGCVRDLGLPLVIAGKPAWNYDASMAAIADSPDVIYLGFVTDDDRVALMQQCAMFVFPSRYEGFGFPVLEAMAAGAPVLTSNEGALREVAGPARILDSLDEEGIAQGITVAIEDMAWRTTSLSEGRAWASRFNWDASVQAHLAIYKKVSDR